MPGSWRLTREYRYRQRRPPRTFCAVDSAVIRVVPRASSTLIRRVSTSEGSASAPPPSAYRAALPLARVPRRFESWLSPRYGVPSISTKSASLRCEISMVLRCFSVRVIHVLAFRQVASPHHVPVAFTASAGSAAAATSAAAAARGRALQRVGRLLLP